MKFAARWYEYFRWLAGPPLNTFVLFQTQLWAVSIQTVCPQNALFLTPSYSHWNFAQGSILQCLAGSVDQVLSDWDNDMGSLSKAARVLWDWCLSICVGNSVFFLSCYFSEVMISGKHGLWVFYVWQFGLMYLIRLFSYEGLILSWRFLA